MRPICRSIEKGGLFATILFLILGILSILYGLKGVFSEEVFSIFHTATVRTVYGPVAVQHSWYYVILGVLIFFLNIYFSFFMKLKKRR